MHAINNPSTDDNCQPAYRIGRDEMNLAEFPIALLTDRVPKGQKTLYFEDKHGRLTVTGSDAYGLPTAVDTDVIVALLYLTKLRNDFRDVKVNFSRYELIKLLGWPDDGGYYKRLDQSFNRWTGVLMVYDKCWWDNKLKKHVSAKMHILESVLIAESAGARRVGQADLPLSSFTWNKTFIESCQADNLRQLNLDTYFALDSAVSKRLYRFLGKRFYLQGDWTFDLNEVAFDRVGLSRSYEQNAGKIKEKLQPAIDELEAIGFLKPLSREDRYTRIDRGQWTIRLTRQSPALVSTQPFVQPTSKPELSPLVAELVSRGVTLSTAAELVEQCPSEVIGRQLEYFDWQMKKKPEKIGEPAGYLVDAIKKDYAAPKGFVSAADRQMREEVRRAKASQEAETRRLEVAEEAKIEIRNRAITAYWEALTPEQQAELDAASIDQADAETLALEKGPMKRFAQQIRRDLYIRQLLDQRSSADT